MTTPANDGGQLIPESEWKWFGNAAHFICGQWCRFHMATKIGDHIISTLGEYVHPRHSCGSEQAEDEWLRDNPFGEDIGCGRKYETMVFETTGNGCECGCGLPKISGSEIDGDGYNAPADATAGHMAMCHKFAARSTPAAEGGKDA